MDDLAAKLILEDEASGTLDAVKAHSDAARQSLEALGRQAAVYDQAMQKWRVPKGFPNAGQFTLPPDLQRGLDINVGGSSAQLEELAARLRDLQSIQLQVAQPITPRVAPILGLDSATAGFAQLVNLASRVQGLELSMPEVGALQTQITAVSDAWRNMQTTMRTDPLAGIAFDNAALLRMQESLLALQHDVQLYRGALRGLSADEQAAMAGMGQAKALQMPVADLNNLNAALGTLQNIRAVALADIPDPLAGPTERIRSSVNSITQMYQNLQGLNVQLPTFEAPADLDEALSAIGKLRERAAAEASGEPVAVDPNEVAKEYAALANLQAALDRLRSKLNAVAGSAMAGTARPVVLVDAPASEKAVTAAMSTVAKAENVAERAAEVRTELASARTGPVAPLIPEAAVAAAERGATRVEKATTNVEEALGKLATEPTGTGTNSPIYKMWGKPVDMATEAVRRYEVAVSRAEAARVGTPTRTDRGAELPETDPEATWDDFMSGSKRAKGSTDELSDSLRGMLHDTDAVSGGMNEAGQQAGRFGRRVRGAGDDSKVSEGNLRQLAIGFRAVASSLATNTFQGAAYNLSLVGRGLSGTAAMAAGAAVSFALLAKGMYDLTQVGAKAAGISTVFENMSKSAGIASRSLVRELQAASHGTLTEVELMQQANRSLMAGGMQITKRLPELLAGARVAAIANGTDISYTYESLVKGIVRGSPRLIDNADIYIRLGDAVGDYAQSIGKSVTELTQQERVQATLTAVLRQLAAAERDMGLTAVTAAEQMQALPKSIEDIRNTAGELLVEHTGITKFFDDVAKLVRGIGSSADAAASIEDLQNAFQGLGENRLADDMWRDWQRVLAQSREVRKSTGNDATAAAWYGVEVDKLIEKWQKLLEEQQAIRDPEQAYRIGLRDSLAAWKAQGGPMADSTMALQAFNDKLVELHDKSFGVESLAEDLAGLADSADLLARGMPAAPKLGGTALTTNADNLREYLKLLRVIRPELGPVIQELGGYVDALEQAQRVTLAKTFQQFGYGTAALQQLAIAAFGTEARVTDLAERFDELDPNTQQVLKNVHLLRYALLDLQEQMAQPLAPDDAFAAVKASINSVESYLASIAGAAPLGALKALDAQMVGEMADMWQAIENENAFGAKVVLQQREEYIRQELAGVAQITELMGRLTTTAQAGIAPPKINESALTTNSRALQDWANQMLGVHPELASLVSGPGGLNEFVTTLRLSEESTLQAAQALGVGRDALAFLAQSAFGADATITDLLDRFQELTPEAQQGALGLGLLNEALRELSNNRRQTVTIDVAVQGLESALDDVDSMSLGLVGMLSTDQIKAFRNRASADIKDAWRTIGATDKFGQDLALAQARLYWQQLVDGTREAYDKRNKIAEEGIPGLAKSAEDLKSAIQGVLSVGTEVTPADVLDTAAGQYKDKALESVRQLNAIANDGRAALSKNKEWIGKFNIPGELLEPNQDAEKRLKAWAARFSKDVQDLSRPDLINWDAFVTEWQDAQARVGRIEGTIDYAVNLLDQKGLLNGKTKEQAREEVRKAMGIETGIKIETLFDVPKDAKQKIIDAILSGDSSLLLPVEVEYKPGTGAGRGLPPEDVAVLAPQQPKYPALIPGMRPAAPAVRPVGPPNTPQPNQQTKLLGEVKVPGAVIGTLTPEQLWGPNWHTDLASGIQAKPVSVATQFAIPLPSAVDLFRSDAQTPFVKQPVSVLAQLGLVSTDAARVRTEVQSYFSGSPVQVAVQLGPVDAVGYRDALVERLNATAVPITTALVLPPTASLTEYLTQLAQLLRSGAPVQAPIVPIASAEALAAFRIATEGTFATDPLRIQATLLTGNPGEPGRAPVAGLEQPAPVLPAQPAAVGLGPSLQGMFTGIDLTVQGAALAGSLFQSFSAVVLTQTPGRLVASAWGADFVQASNIWNMVGAAAGTRVAAAFEAAMLGAVGQIRTRMAELIAPEVAAILNRRGSRPGEAALP